MAVSRIGPFGLEAPLAPPTTAGQMFRGIHIEQRKLAALRVFPLPLGMTPESRQAYADQIENLKQLRHPGIVRCYGGGFDNRRAYLAYELIDGHSLDQILERRSRLPWETTSDYSRQIAEALQYALKFDWSHGRLQPSKIMITDSGITKILDWRRDHISAMLNSPHTLEQIQISAPEIIEGETPSEKSDLYSLGCLMFQMLTGEPAFPGDSIEEVIQAIRLSNPPAVASKVFDCPIWLNAIVEQLLSKSPQKRPYGITAFLLALKEAQRRESEGVGVLQHAASGFSPLMLNVDRHEAEKVLGIKEVKKKKNSETSLWESPLVLLAGLILAVAGVIWFLMPPSEKSLYQRAEKLLSSEKWTDWNAARDGHLSLLLERFPDSQYREWAEEKIGWVNAREVERRMEREERMGRRDKWTPAQTQYSEAKKYERFGDYLTALEKFRAIQTLFARQEDAQSIVYLAAEGIQRIQKTQGKDALQVLLQKKMEEADQAANRAQLSVAKMIWEAIVELYSNNQQAAPIVERAQQRLAEINTKR